MSLRKDWRDYLLTANEAEEAEVAQIVFEEESGEKNYDLCVGIFSDLEVAKEYASELNKKANENNKKYVANYRDYVAGNYDYLQVMTWETNTQKHRKKPLPNLWQINTQ